MIEIIHDHAFDNSTHHDDQMDYLKCGNKEIFIIADGVSECEVGRIASVLSCKYAKEYFRNLIKENFSTTSSDENFKEPQEPENNQREYKKNGDTTIISKSFDVLITEVIDFIGDKIKGDFENIISGRLDWKEELKNYGEKYGKEDIENHINSISLKIKNAKKPIFIWNEITSNKINLYIFLKEKYGVEWEDSRIKEIDDENIKVTSKSNKIIYLKLDMEKKKLILTFDNITEEFIVKIEDEKIKIFKKLDFQTTFALMIIDTENDYVSTGILGDPVIIIIKKDSTLFHYGISDNNSVKTYMSVEEGRMGFIDICNRKLYEGDKIVFGSDGSNIFFKTGSGYPLQLFKNTINKNVEKPADAWLKKLRDDENVIDDDFSLFVIKVKEKVEVIENEL